MLAAANTSFAGFIASLKRSRVITDRFTALHDLINSSSTLTAAQRTRIASLINECRAQASAWKKSDRRDRADEFLVNVARFVSEFATRAVPLGMGVKKTRSRFLKK